MQVIIVGGGKTGAHLASRLTDDGIAVTVIEQRVEVVKRLCQICPNVSVIEGSGSDPEVLERAGVRIADAVAAVTGLDETNLVTSMLAKMGICGAARRGACEQPGERVDVHAGERCGRGCESGRDHGALLD